MLAVLLILFDDSSYILTAEYVVHSLIALFDTIALRDMGPMCLLYYRSLCR